jgi:hypothetical protein
MNNEDIMLVTIDNMTYIPQLYVQGPIVHPIPLSKKICYELVTRGYSVNLHTEGKKEKLTSEWFLPKKPSPAAVENKQEKEKNESFGETIPVTVPVTATAAESQKLSRSEKKKLRMQAATNQPEATTPEEPAEPATEN